MSLDITLYFEVDTGKEDDWYVVHDANITHNLGLMAYKAGIYHCLWRQHETQVKYAADLIQRLSDGLERMKKYPAYFKQFDSPNGWGMYKHFVQWVENCLNACREYPKAKVDTSV